MTLAARVSLPVIQEPRLPRRPRVRGDCANSPRPCPWVSCRHNLFLDIDGKGSIKFTHPGLDVDQMVDTCSLDVADDAIRKALEMPDDHGALGLRAVGDFLGIGLERARQIERKALAQMRLLLGRDAASEPTEEWQMQRGPLTWLRDAAAEPPEE